MKSGQYRQAIATKVLLPQDASVMERARLLELIPQIQSKQLSLIKAPAGFGKTSFAVTLAKHLLRTGHQVAWLSIDKDDNEPSQFLFYLCHALRRACGEVGRSAIDLLQEASLINSQTVISLLINDLSEVEDDIYLFLEDFHWISNEAINGAIEFLLLRAPSNFHVVIITRSWPSLPVAELRVQNKLLEIDAASLRFSLEETCKFFERENIGPLSSAELREFNERSEGWPAVLRIVASAIIQSGDTFSRYTSELSGTSRPISEYFTQMMDRLPRDLALFMLQTSILDHFSAPLCQAVTQHAEQRDAFIRL